MEPRDYPGWIKRLGERLAPEPVKPCAGCTACCHTVGVAEIGLKPFTRCQHERGVPWTPGCAIYATRPSSCRSWSCQYALEGWDDELRPDRCGVVVGPEPDLFRLRDGTTGELHEVAAIQMWATPGFEEAYLAVVLAAIDGGAAILWRYRRPEDGVPVGLSIGKHNGEIYRTAPAEVHAGFTASMSAGERTRKADALLKGRRG